MNARHWLVAAAVTAGLLVACLPKDTRPPPGSLFVSAQPSDALLHGTTTVDGWSLSFERTLLSIARIRIDGSSCSGYYAPEYGRILTFANDAPQKVGIFYALGVCDSFRFGIGAPDTDALLGAGVTENDKTLMRTPGPDPYMPDSGVSAIISGSATSGATTKSFHWTFRERADDRNCDGVTLAGNQALTYSLVFHPEDLFHDSVDPQSAKLRFQAVADADADGDGEVTLVELGAVTLDEIKAPDRYLLPAEIVSMLTDAGVDDGNSGLEAGVTPYPDAGVDVEPALQDGMVPSSLGDWVYLLLVPESLHLTGGSQCSIRVSGAGRGGGGF